MVKITSEYLGDLECEMTHGPSGAKIIAQAPVDNHGKGEAFSPTDMVAAAVIGCMSIVMAIYANRHQIDLKGLKMSIDKEMVATPIRRIGRLGINVEFTKHLNEDMKEQLKRVGETCPVKKSLHDDIVIDINYL